MKPSEVDHKPTAEALHHILTLLGLDVEEALVLDRTDRRALEERVDLLVATPRGVLDVRHEEVSAYERRWRMTSEFIPWSALTPVEVRSESFRMPEQGFSTEVTVSFPRGEGWTFTTDTSRERKRATGLLEFAAAVVRWIEPLRM